MGKLEGKIAIVVGSTSGIGKAIAERFAKEGATTIITGRRKEIGKTIVDGITKEGGNAEFYKLDVRDINACYGLIETVIDKYGKLDILEYNAGLGNPGKIEETYLGNITPEVWDIIFETNLKSAFFTVQKALPELVKTKGNVIFTASIGGFSAFATRSNIPYGSTKAALLMLMRIVALNMADKHVRVNAVAPGVTETDILTKASQSTIDQLCSEVPMKEMTKPEDVADAALFLASDEASHITGQHIAICGGQCLI